VKGTGASILDFNKTKPHQIEVNNLANLQFKPPQVNKDKLKDKNESSLVGNPNENVSSNVDLITQTLLNKSNNNEIFKEITKNIKERSDNITGWEFLKIYSFFCCRGNMQYIDQYNYILYKMTKFLDIGNFVIIQNELKIFKRIFNVNERKALKILARNLFYKDYKDVYYIRKTNLLENAKITLDENKNISKILEYYTSKF